MDYNIWVTLTVVGGGLIAQAAYLKGTFSTRISNNEKAITDLIKNGQSIHKRLDAGQSTFATIRENIATQTASLEHIMGEYSRLCTNLDHLREESVSKDTHVAVNDGLDGRIQRLEKVANGRL